MSVSKAAEKTKAARMRVYLRLRPLTFGLGEEVDEDQNTIEVVSDETIRVVPPPSVQVTKSKNSDVRDLRFSRVFGPDSSQELLYTSVGQPLVRDFIEKEQNVLLFAYGITNSGKTYTMLGKENAQGILPRALTDIFGALEAKKASGGADGISLRLSYLEIYNETVIDLLGEGAPPRGGLKLKDRAGHIEVQNLTRHAIGTAEAAMAHLSAGAARRACATNNINKQSSRSHSVCSIELLPGAAGARPLCAFWVVDLAGAERGGKTGVAAGGRRQQEANSINTSLMKLWRCLSLMRKNQEKESGGPEGAPRQIVPFRESKLTHLFSNHLAGQSPGQTCIVVNVNPSAAYYSETQHVLGHAALAQKVRSVDNTRRYLKAYARLQGTHGLDGRRRRRRSKGASPLPAGKAPRPKESSQDEESLSGAETDSTLASSSRMLYRQRQQVSEKNALLMLTVARLKEELVVLEGQTRDEFAEALYGGFAAPPPPENAPAEPPAAPGEAAPAPARLLRGLASSRAAQAAWTRAAALLEGAAAAGPRPPEAAAASRAASAEDRARAEAAVWLQTALSATAVGEGAEGAEAEEGEEGEAPGPHCSSPEALSTLRVELLENEVRALRKHIRAGEAASKRRAAQADAAQSDAGRQLRRLEEWKERAIKAEAQISVLEKRDRVLAEATLYATNQENKTPVAGEGRRKSDRGSMQWAAHSPARQSGARGSLEWAEVAPVAADVDPARKYAMAKGKGDAGAYHPSPFRHRTSEVAANAVADG